MPRIMDLQALLDGCADTSFHDGIRIDADLEPISGPGGPVKPAVYEGGAYQHDQRWGSPADEHPTPVIVIDNVPSQANRLEDALRRNRYSAELPEFVLDLSSLANLPAHLPKRISSLQFPHRNADAYLRDARLGDQDFLKTDLGKSIFNATAQDCGPLVAWFPQALLYGFWQSHLGKKRAKHETPPRVGVGDHRLEAGGDRHAGDGPQGRSAESQHGRRHHLEPRRPPGMDHRERPASRGRQVGQTV